MASKKTAVSLVIGSAFAATMAAAPIASAADNPFQMDSLKNGYQIAGVAKGEENKCGEAKCGGATDDDKGGEAKCGEAKCGGSK
ncbi:MAG: hypothetical protein AMJ66_03910 [Betaproteobacteria bacterium SG8_40]|jgi:uncharacterized low-complexity protein|nr:MAG: hypothetical protein AMJ66_03910 [Betaproteobacteria bacterium SG8_40]